MIAIRTMKQLATSRSIPSFRFAPSSMDISSRVVDRGRMAAGYSQVVNHETRRQIRNHQMNHRLRNFISS
jgi:hypothetical protein